MSTDKKSHYAVTDLGGLGHKVWAIPDGYIPGWSHGPGPQMVSHEAICILNTGEQEAHIDISIYFEDREPAGPYRFTIGARRTSHLRVNDFNEPERIPADTPFSTVVAADVPVVVQHTRLDSRQAENALLTTIAFPVASGDL